MGEENLAKNKSRDRVRNERLSKALRENLKRRKAQIRNRDGETRPPAPGARVPFEEDSNQP